MQKQIAIILFVAVFLAVVFSFFMAAIIGYIMHALAILFLLGASYVAVKTLGRNLLCQIKGRTIVCD
jgi:hypothetical protein